MPTAEVRETLPASCDAVFALIHDYRRRLEWDTLLSEAYLEPEFAESGKGAISVCRGRKLLGSIALRTQYVAFEKGKLAAIKMLNQPPFFDAFAASIRHIPMGDAQSEVVYKVTFTAKPPWLRPILHPIMQAIFVQETRRRLRALKEFFQRGEPV